MSKYRTFQEQYNIKSKYNVAIPNCCDRRVKTYQHTQHQLQEFFVFVIKRRHIHCLKFFLENNTINFKFRIPIVLKSKNVSYLELLLQKNVLNVRLMFNAAICGEHFTALKILLAYHSSEPTHVRLAINAKQLYCLKLLIKNGARVTRQDIAVARKYNNLQILKYLLEVYPMDETFFSSAVHHGNGDFLNLLFDVYNPNVTFCCSLLNSCNDTICKKIITNYVDMKNCSDKISALNIL